MEGNTDAATKLDEVLESTLRFLDRDAVLGFNDQVIEEVEVPEWGGVICVRNLTGDERDDFEQSMVETRGKRREVRMKAVRAGLVARAACTPEGVRIFADRDIAALGKKSAAALDRVYQKAAELSGLREQDVEELVEDFSDGPGGPSTTS